MHLILSIADIIEDAVLHRDVCPRVGQAAYGRVRDVNRLAEEGSICVDEARRHALADLKRALETPRLPDPLSPEPFRHPALEIPHA